MDYIVVDTSVDEGEPFAFKSGVALKALAHAIERGHITVIRCDVADRAVRIASAPPRLRRIWDRGHIRWHRVVRWSISPEQERQSSIHAFFDNVVVQGRAAGARFVGLAAP